MEMFQNRFFQLRIQHGGAPVQHHALYIAVRIQVREAGNDSQHGMGRSPDVYRQHGRCSRNRRHPVGACFAGKSHAVIIAHDSFRHRQVKAPASHGHPIAQHIFVQKLQVQVPAGGMQCRSMKHGVNVIRSALKGADLFSPKGQRRQQPRNQCGFSSAAVGTGNQNAVQCFFHTIPTKTAAAKLTAAVCFPKKSGGVVTPPKETYTRRLLLWRAICQVGKGETTKTAPKQKKCGSTQAAAAVFLRQKPPCAPYLRSAAIKPFQQVS